MSARRFTRLPALVLATLMLAATAAPAAAAAPEAQLEAARAERAEIQAELDKAVAAYDGAQAQLAQTQESLELNRKSLQAAEAMEIEAQDRLSERAGAIYRQGPSSMFRFLLGADDFGDFGRRLKLLEDAAQEDSEVVAEAEQTRSRVAALQAKLSADQQAQERLVETMAEQTESLTANFARAQDLEDGLQDEVREALAAERRRRAEAEAAERARAEAEAEAAERARAEAEEQARREAARRAAAEPAAPSPSASAATTTSPPPPGPAAQPAPAPPPPPAPAPPPGIACPIDGPNAFTDTWGAPRSGGRRHQGVDMFAAARTPVAAVVDGVIVRRTSGGLGGHGIYLRGNDGTEYYYAHLDGFTDVPEGASVKAGDHIAYVGNSGNAAGGPPHVHFEVLTQNGSVNPTPFARRACG